MKTEVNESELRLVTLLLSFREPSGLSRKVFASQLLEFMMCIWKMIATISGEAVLRSYKDLDLIMQLMTR